MILDSCFDQLFEHYDRYIRRTDQIPWWWVEQTIVADLHAAAFAAGSVSCTEYEVPRNGVSGKGRGDLWIQSTNPRGEVCVEAKQCWVRPGTWWTTEAYPLLREARASAGMNDDGFECVGICAARIAYSKAITTNWWELWLGADCAETISIGEVDYFAFYLMNEQYQRKSTNESGSVFPGLFLLVREEQVHG